MTDIAMEEVVWWMNLKQIIKQQKAKVLNCFKNELKEVPGGLVHLSHTLTSPFLCYFPQTC